MYESFYGLSTNPFLLVPDPNFFYESSCHKRGLAYLRYGLVQGQGFIVITGKPGTGKSMLAQTVLPEISRQRIVSATIANSNLGTDDFLKTVASSFHVPLLDGCKASLLFALEKYFVDQERCNKRVLLIVDEAQNLPKESLEELRMLSNYQKGSRALMQAILLGQPQLQKKLADPDMEQFSQRVIASYHLQPLDVHETRSYIEHRLLCAGWKGDPGFTAGALAIIYSCSRGIPRLINTFCDRLLLSSAMEEKHKINRHHVNDLLAELQDEATDHWIKSIPLNEIPNVFPLPDSRGLHSVMKSNASPADLIRKGEIRSVGGTASLDGRGGHSFGGSHGRALMNPALNSAQQAVAMVHEMESADSDKSLMTSDLPIIDEVGKTPGDEIKVQNYDSGGEVSEGKRLQVMLLSVVVLVSSLFIVVTLQRGGEEGEVENVMDKSVAFSIGIDSNEQNKLLEPDESESISGQDVGIALVEDKGMLSISSDPKEVEIKNLEAVDQKQLYVPVATKNIEPEATDKKIDKSPSLEKLEDFKISQVQEENNKVKSDMRVSDVEVVPVILAGVGDNKLIKKSNDALVKHVNVLPAEEKTDASNPDHMTDSEHKIGNRKAVDNFNTALLSSQNDISLPPPIDLEAVGAGFSRVDQEKQTSLNKENIHTIRLAGQQVSELELSDFLHSFVMAYEKGDLQKFISLFTADASTGDSYGSREISRDYQELFNVTEMRRMEILEIQWQGNGDHVSGESEFKVSVWERKGGDPSVFDGVINLEIVKDDGRLLIQQMTHNLRQ